MLTAKKALSLAQQYTEDTVMGMGAIKGDKGDRGEKGEKGDRGDRGEKGDKGDRGYTGATGDNGADGITPSLSVGNVQQGSEAGASISGTADNLKLNLVLPKGDKGDKGDKGEDGQNGSSFSIRSRFASVEELQIAFPDGPDNEGDAYFVGSSASPDLYVWLVEDREWHNNGPIAGVKGDKGDQGDEGYSPVAQVVKDDETGVVTISIRDKAGLTTAQVQDGEKGADGDNGKSAYEVAVDEGFEGSESEWLAELVGPQGPQGIQGETGMAPHATVTQLSDGAVIEIEDENGTTSATVKNVSGELVPSVTKYQSGTIDNGALIPANSSSLQAVTFDTPMPDSDYLVALNDYNLGLDVQFRNRKTTGFDIYARNFTDVPININVHWQAFKLITDAALLANEAKIQTNEDAISAIQEKIPSDASTSNKLATSTDIAPKQNKTLDTALSIGGASRTTVEAALGAVNGLIPSGASGSNQLATATDVTGVRSSIYKKAEVYAMSAAGYIVLSGLVGNSAYQTNSYLISNRSGELVLLTVNSGSGTGVIRDVAVTRLEKGDSYIDVTAFEYNEAQVAFHVKQYSLIRVVQVSGIVCTPSAAFSASDPALGSTATVTSAIRSTDLTATVTSGSSAPVTSGGVYSALKTISKNGTETSKNYVVICTVSQLLALTGRTYRGFRFTYMSWGGGCYIYDGIGRVNSDGSLLNVVNRYTVAGTTPAIKVVDSEWRYYPGGEDATLSIGAYALKFEVI